MLTLLVTLAGSALCTLPQNCHALRTLIHTSTDVVTHRFYIEKNMQNLKLETPGDLPLVNQIFKGTHVIYADHQTGFIDDGGGSHATLVLLFKYTVIPFLFTQRYFHDNNTMTRSSTWTVNDSRNLPIFVLRTVAAGRGALCARLFESEPHPFAVVSTSSMEAFFRAIVWPWGKYCEGYNGNYVLERTHEDDDVLFHED
eukprot:TRINITY_DN3752_c0_g1_i1.p1 TRINITY_DN3752_c0_g1~~TRINITY_DN3752_c0_g1_i1.p1  ORF type:complete len:199 (-),score=19.24 TRINITY_DN3752_c0_g1_i1:140-736(-)